MTFDQNITHERLHLGEVPGRQVYVQGAHGALEGAAFSPAANWIWSPERSPNQYVLFVKDVMLPADVATLDVRISASYHYELFVDGTFISRGPIHGDPKWCRVDAYRLALVDRAPGTGARAGDRRVQFAIVVHHASDTHLHYLIPAPAGLIAEVSCGDEVIGTDASWRCVDLPMWRQDVPPRGWALDYCEDYDARLEPEGWADKRFSSDITATWPCAALVPDADAMWSGYQLRMTPYLERRFSRPSAFAVWHAPHPGAQDVGDISQLADEESLEPVAPWQGYDQDAADAALAKGNAITLDLGAETVGFYEVELEAPAGVVVEISGAELLRDGRPWIYRKGTRYSVRYVTRAGRQTFTAFGWSGFRYLHVVIRGETEGVRLLRAGCLERRAFLSLRRAFSTDDLRLQAVFDMCERTLAIGAQELLIDCPTREQTQYWGDALHIAESLWIGFGERSYMDCYLTGFLHAALREDGQLSCTYPGQHNALLDYTLIPVLGQRITREYTGSYYRPAATLDKALQVKLWYDAHLNEAGLVAFDYEAYAEKGLRNFIDHPGIGWHNFPHPGIDRQGVSCPLNAFFYGFVRTLAEIAASLGRPEAAPLRAQADALAVTIGATFYDGVVFHDAIDQGVLSPGTSWQTNALAVYFDLVTGPQATQVMQTMLDGYDSLCRSSPYFHFYFLPALRKVGLVAEAMALIKREWGAMVDAGATTTWEGFLGDEKDSLCHPWSTAPFLFLLRENE